MSQEARLVILQQPFDELRFWESVEDNWKLLSDSSFVRDGIFFQGMIFLYDFFLNFSKSREI